MVEERPTAPVSLPGNTSARNAGIVGAVFGLMVVAAFVLAVRIAYHPRQQTGASAKPTPTTGVTGVISPAPSANSWIPSPGVPANPSASTQVQPKNSVPGGHVTGVPASSASQKPAGRVGDTQPLGVTTGGTVVTNPKPAAVPAGTDRPATDDSAPSMVPVIPQGPPPEVDPLVKAVLEADDPHRK